MTQVIFPTIDLHATGENIIRLRKANGLSVRELQHYFGFEEPQAIYKWQQGKCLPSVDNLYALSRLLGVSMNEILVQTPQLNLTDNGQSFDCPFNHVFKIYPDRLTSNRITELSIYLRLLPYKIVWRKPLFYYFYFNHLFLAKRFVNRRITI